MLCLQFFVSDEFSQLMLNLVLLFLLGVAVLLAAFNMLLALLDGLLTVPQIFLQHLGFSLSFLLAVLEFLVFAEGLFGVEACQAGTQLLDGSAECFLLLEFGIALAGFCALFFQPAAECVFLHMLPIGGQHRSGLSRELTTIEQGAQLAAGQDKDRCGKTCGLCLQAAQKLCGAVFGGDDGSGPKGIALEKFCTILSGTAGRAIGIGTALQHAEVLLPVLQQIGQQRICRESIRLGVEIDEAVRLAANERKFFLLARLPDQTVTQLIGQEGSALIELLRTAGHIGTLRLLLQFLQEFFGRAVDGTDLCGERLEVLLQLLKLLAMGGEIRLQVMFLFRIEGKIFLIVCQLGTDLLQLMFP